MPPLREVLTEDRIKSGIAVAAFHALIGYALIIGLGIDVASAIDERLKIFSVPPEALPPPLEEVKPPQEPTKEKAERVKAAPKDPEGAAAPPNIKSRPTEIVAPKPEIKLPVPSPVIAAPIAGVGAAATSGNAPVFGPGTGAGGIGNGTGSGRYGNGGGGGGGSRVASNPSYVSGGVTDRDYPRAAREAGAQGYVGMRFLITPQGRVGRCLVSQSSGNRSLDQETCQLMQARLRYRPARDIYGRPVAAWTEGEQEWFLTQQPDRWVEADIPDDG